MKRRVITLLLYLLLSCFLLGNSKPFSTLDKSTYSNIKIEIEEDYLWLLSNKGPYQLNYEIKPKLPIVILDKWESSNENVATVKDGLITPVSQGSCIISYSIGKLKDEVKVDVRVSDYYGEAPEIENIEGLTYFGDILIANKSYDMPATYNPGLRIECQTAFDDMKKAAELDGINLFILSGYRSYDYQYKLYNKYVKQSSIAAADTYSARPGHSEHQTGLALDINWIDYAFADTKEGQWINEHCADYGFIIRYPEDKTEITGYIYEPWHIRYVGTENALKIKESGLCLEEYLGIDSKYK